MLKGLSSKEKENIYSFNLNGDKLEAARGDFMNIVKNNFNVSAYHRNGLVFGLESPRFFMGRNLRRNKTKTVSTNACRHKLFFVC